MIHTSYQKLLAISSRQLRRKSTFVRQLGWINMRHSGDEDQRDVSYNQITGEIPYNIGFLKWQLYHFKETSWPGKFQKDLSNNELVGPIPPILGNLSYTRKLYLHGNMLTGPIPPKLGNTSKLSYL